MLSNYLLCPLLLSESALFNATHPHEPLEYWRRQLCCAPTLNLQSDITTFVDQHLFQCHCPPSFPRGKKSAKAALKHWISIRDPQRTNNTHLSTNEKRIDSYDQYLTTVVGLAPSTRSYRRRYAAEFLDWLSTEHIHLSQLSGLQLNSYITALSHASTAVSNASQRATSLKSFISFLAAEDDISIVWTSSITHPKVNHCIATTLPLTDDELSSLLKVFDRSQPIGKRDYAMARCLIDLGVRTSDVAELRLDRIDWRRGNITLEAGKSRRERTLPMTDTAIDALADYLYSGRPVTQDRHVFVHHRAPLGKGIPASTVRGALRRAYARAGFISSESQLHRLRHTMATRLLHNKQSLKTIADMLGHLSINTTTRYTHVDRELLAVVAMPWPQGDKL